MSSFGPVIPEHIRRLISPEDLKTYDAAAVRALTRRETQEQKIFNNWLKLRRAERKLHPVNPRSDKATTIHKGHPDYSIFLSRGRVLLMEMKVEGGILSPDQTECITLLNELDHQVQIPWSAAQAIEIVRRFL